MKPVLSGNHIRYCEQKTIESGVSSRVLMRRVAEYSFQILENPALFPATPDTLFLVFCGAGNNGADGFALARLLNRWRQDDPRGHARVIYTGAWTETEPDTERMSEECLSQYRAYISDFGLVLPNAPSPASLSSDVILIDAMVGIGLHAAPDPALTAHIRAVNSFHAPTLAIDIPTGIDADTGVIPGEVVRASATITMTCQKPGLLFYPGREYAGVVHICDIGVEVSRPEAMLFERDDLHSLPKRSSDGNKSNFGRVLTVGSDVGMGGATYLAALSAYRTGAGLVEMCSDENNRIILQTLLPEALFSPYEGLPKALSRADTVAIGFGLHADEKSLSLLQTVLKADKPTVIDAGCLTLLARHKELLPLLEERTAPIVLTPHPGEASRLLGIPVASVKANLIANAKEIARIYPNTVCILKDAGAIVTDGKDVQLYITGNSAMATGGSGDCLAGVVASLLCHVKDKKLSPLQSAAFAALIHGTAGELVAEKLGHAGVLARDIANGIGDVLKEAVG